MSGSVSLSKYCCHQIHFQDIFVFQKNVPCPKKQNKPKVTFFHSTLKTLVVFIIGRQIQIFYERIDSCGFFLCSELCRYLGTKSRSILLYILQLCSSTTLRNKLFFASMSMCLLLLLYFGWKVSQWKAGKVSVPCNSLELPIRSQASCTKSLLFQTVNKCLTFPWAPYVM